MVLKIYSHNVTSRQFYVGLHFMVETRLGSICLIGRTY